MCKAIGAWEQNSGSLEQPKFQCDISMVLGGRDIGRRKKAECRDESHNLVGINAWCVYAFLSHFALEKNSGNWIVCNNIIL